MGVFCLFVQSVLEQSKILIKKRSEKNIHFTKTDPSLIVSIREMQRECRQKQGMQEEEEEEVDNTEEVVSHTNIREWVVATRGIPLCVWLCCSGWRTRMPRSLAQQHQQGECVVVAANPNEKNQYLNRKNVRIGVVRACLVRGGELPDTAPPTLPHTDTQPPALTSPATPACL